MSLNKGMCVPGLSISLPLLTVPAVLVTPPGSSHPPMAQDPLLPHGAVSSCLWCYRRASLQPHSPALPQVLLSRVQPVSQPVSQLCPGSSYHHGLIWWPGHGSRSAQLRPGAVDGPWRRRTWQLPAPALWGATSHCCSLAFSKVSLGFLQVLV